ncbi:hypothetical protein B0H13DRAFT_2530061 [Mycena leptocephala]|nr:hypothetical protein B0H13DRAFT_2530061 [Mycena leptocephala]
MTSTNSGLPSPGVIDWAGWFLVNTAITMKNVGSKASKDTPTAKRPTNDRTKISTAEDPIAARRKRTVEAVLNNPSDVSRKDAWDLTKPYLVQILQSRGRPFRGTVSTLRDRVFLILELDLRDAPAPERRQNLELTDDVLGLDKPASRRKQASVETVEDVVDPAPEVKSPRNQAPPRMRTVRQPYKKKEHRIRCQEQVPKISRPRTGMKAARTGLPRDAETGRNAIPKLIILKSVKQLEAALQIKRGYKGYLTVASLNTQLDWHVDNPVSDPADPQNTSASGIPEFKRRGRRDNHIEYLKRAIQSRCDILECARGNSVASDGMQQPDIHPSDVSGKTEPALIPEDVEMPFYDPEPHFPDWATTKNRKYPWEDRAASLPKDFVKNLTERLVSQDATTTV